MSSNDISMPKIQEKQQISEEFPIKTQANFLKIFDISSELNQYTRLFISKEFDYFRNFHCFENFNRDYKVYGELPNGDKMQLFTVKRHFECDFCNICKDCSVQCFCFDYVFCDKIIFQMDYKRNNNNFYTQGVNRIKGCYICQLDCSCFFCCNFCCPPNILFLRENNDPDNPDFNVGVHKGNTKGTPNHCCSGYISDRTASYTEENQTKGPKIRLKCCEFWKHTMTCCFGHCFDIDMQIEDGNNNKIGSIKVPYGWCSQKVKNTLCFLPGKYYEINLTKQITSEQKFQIIADIIHFDIENGIL